MDEQRSANSSIDDYIASFPNSMSKIPSRAGLITIAERSSTVRLSLSLRRERHPPTALEMMNQCLPTRSSSISKQLRLSLR